MEEFFTTFVISVIKYVVIQVFIFRISISFSIKIICKFVTVRCFSVSPVNILYDITVLGKNIILKGTVKSLRMSAYKVWNVVTK